MSASERAPRICAATGFALVPSPVTALRVARESYGPLQPPIRDVDSDPAGWSRFDTPGRTLYACDEPLTAYMELLAPYRAEVDGEHAALQPLADSMGIPLPELWNAIVDEWDAGSTMKARWLPSSFREGRMLYTLSFHTGWWIDIAAMESISALSDWVSADREQPLTLSDVTGEDRLLTTAIATALRHQVVLDDGTLPMGIRFISKHGLPSTGTGACWAYWQRDVDNGLTEPTRIIHRAAIEQSDGALQQALEFCKIRSR